MKNPSITVLMAVYNGEKYIRSSVESVLQQSFADFEFLIINDKSTDQTLTILQEYREKDPRIVIHTNQNNIGQTKSLNTGLRLAKGEYVARIDADDFALPRWLETQVAAARKNPKSAVISAQALVIDENNSILRIARSPAALQDIILRSFTFSPINHVGSILKKDTVIKNGGYDENYKTAADFDLWGKLIRSGENIRSSGEALVAIRMHAQSYSMTEIDKGGLAEISGIMKKNINHFTRRGISDKEVDLLCRVFYREGCLTDDEFERAVAILKRIYADVSVPHLAPDNTINKWSAARCRVAYLKRIYFFITQRKYAAARMLSWKGVQEFGPVSVFMALWGAALLGGRILSLIPKFYNSLLRQKTLLFPGVGQSTGRFNGLLKELSERQYYLDFFGFFSIGIFSLGYVVFYRQFAELNIQLPFLNFPIFVGEILLFLCLCAFFLKGNLRIEQKHYWIVGYFAFVLLKALNGYIKFGPLALRHAALFYYPAFIIFTYAFYRKEFLNREKSILIIAILLTALARPGFIDYFLFTCVTLVFILIHAYPGKILKYVSFAALSLIIPYKSFFATSRMGLVANGAAGIYVIVGLYCISRLKKFQKLTLVVLGLLLLTWLVFRYSDKNSLLTLVRPNIIVSKFIEHDKLFKGLHGQSLIIGQKLGDTAYFGINEPRQIQVYNPDQLLTAPRLSVEEETIRRRIAVNRASVTTSIEGEFDLEPNKTSGGGLKDSTGHESVLEEAPKTELATSNPLLHLESKESLEGGLKDSTGHESVLEEAPKAELAAQKLASLPASIPASGDTWPVPLVNSLSKASGPATETAVIVNEEVPKADLATQKLASLPASIPASGDTWPVPLIDSLSKASGPATVTAVIVNDEVERPDEPEPSPALKSSQAINDSSPKPIKSLASFDDVEVYSQDQGKQNKWREIGPAYGNAVFRLLIWRDMITEMVNEKPVLGFSFGKPFRSVTLETLMWGYGDWHRDGWIGAHNSFMEIIYRMGIIGLCLIGYIIRILSRMVMRSIRSKSLIGVLLCGIIVYWFAGANFLMILELPYTAIPIWSIFGLAYAYISRLQPAH